MSSYFLYPRGLVTSDGLHCCLVLAVYACYPSFSRDVLVTCSVSLFLPSTLLVSHPLLPDSAARLLMTIRLNLIGLLSMHVWSFGSCAGVSQYGHIYGESSGIVPPGD